jgi:serine/threonine-protein kinase
MLHKDSGLHAVHRNRPTAPLSTSLAPIAAVPPTTASARPPRPSITPHTDPQTGPPTGSTTPSAPPPDPIVALRQTIAQQVTAGGLKADAANDLNHMVDDLAHTTATGNAGEVTNKIKAMRAKLTTLNREGKLSAGGYQVLNTAVNQVAASQG